MRAPRTTIAIAIAGLTIAGVLTVVHDPPPAPVASRRDDSRSVARLEAQLRRMQGELRMLRGRVGAIQREPTIVRELVDSSAPEPESQTEQPPDSERKDPRPPFELPTDPDTRRRFRDAYYETMEATLAESFHTEASDPDWSASTETYLRDTMDVSDSPFAGQSRATHIECRSTMCYAEIEHDTRSAMNAFRTKSNDDETAPRVLGYRQRRNVERDDGRFATKIYYTKVGHRLPRLDPRDVEFDG